MSVPVFPHSCHHLVLPVSWILAILIGVYGYLTVALICNFLRICDVKHPFTVCLPLVYLLGEVSSIFCPFFIGLFIFLLLDFKSSLYILELSPLSDMCFANIFCQFIVCLLVLLTMPLGFPGGTVVENPPASAGDTGLSPGAGRSHMPWNNKAHATTTEPVL